jgi:hypothetical protein
MTTNDNERLVRLERAVAQVGLALFSAGLSGSVRKREHAELEELIADYQAAVTSEAERITIAAQNRWGKRGQA